MRRFLVIFLGFAAGWLVYMIGMALTVYDGVGSLIFQPIMAGLFSGAFVILALLAGLVLKIPVLSRWSRTNRRWALALVLGSLVVLSCGYSLGITQVYTDHETGQQFTGLHSVAALGAYFGMIFGFCNWPLRDEDSEA